MNEEYLRGYFQTYVQPSRKDATYEDWVVKIKDNEEYKRGMFETNVLPSKSDAVYEDWNSKVFGTSPVKKKEPSDSKPVGSPIGSAVGEAAKTAARQPEAPVVSPKLGSIVQKAQGALPQSAKSAVSGLEKGSPSMLKSTSESGENKPKTGGYWEFAKVLSDNSDKEFVQRMGKPDFSITNDDGSVSTHKMSTANVDNKEIVFPTIVNIDGKLYDWSDDVEKALDFALEKNEYISFDDPNKARQFAEGAWKSIASDYNKKTSVSEGETPKTEDLATSLEGTDFEMGAFTEPPGAERVKTRTQFSAGESQARTALYDIQSGKAPNYVSANELEKVIKSGGLDEKQFTDYQKESVDRYNTIKAESQKIEQEYLQSGQERLKAIADKDKEYNEFFRKTQAEVNQFAQTATSQAELDNYIAQKEVELNAVYDKAKERAVKILDAEIQKKFEDIYNRNMPGVDLIEKSGLKNQLDEITNDPNFDILSFDKKKDLLKSMYVTIGNSLAKKGMGDAATLLKLREQLDANYLNKFYISKEEQFTPFALKQYAEQQVPEMEKKLNELNALYKKQQESGNMAGGYYTNEETGEQMPTGEAIVKYKEALRNLQLIQDMPDQKGAGAFSDFVKGFSSVPLAEKTPFLASLIGVGRTGSLYNSATKEQKSEADESLLRTEAMLQDYASQTSDQRSVWYDAGKSTAHSVPFMGEFIMTMGVGRTTVKGLETLAKKKIKDYGESKARRFLLKPLFETIGTVAQTSANPQQVALNTFERMTPEMQLVMSEEGDRLVSKVDQNTGEDFDEAFLKGFGQTWAEFFTERAGSAIPFYTKGLSGQLLPKSPEWVKRAFISLYMRKTGTNITQAYNRLKNVGWDGVLGEFAEEIFIMPLENIITGDYKDPRNGPYSSVLNGIIDPKTGELDERNLKQIAISTTAMTLPMVGGGMIVSALPEGKTSIQMMDVNGNTYQAKLRNSILAQIVAESKKKGNALADFRDTKLSKLDLSMDEMYIANKVIDALENRNAQTRIGGGTLSEADAKLIEELDKLDLENAESETITQVEQPVVSPETSTVDVTMESAPEKAASPETEQIQAQDDSTDITGVSGEVREGEEPIQTQPDETGGREAAETGGVLQSEVQGEELVEVGEAPKKTASPKEIKAELDKRNTDDVFVPVEEGGILGNQNFKKKAQQMFMAFKKVTWDDVYSKRNRKPEYATKQGQRKFEKEFEKWAKENKNQIIAESYVESKANGTNKEFVEAVDNLLASPKETKRTKEIRERRQKAQAIIEKRKLQEEKESQKESGEFRKTVIAESRKAQPTAYRAVLQYFMQGGKVPVVIFEREVSKQKSEIDRRVGINGILERVDVSETDLKRKGLDAIAERIVGDMGVPESSFSDMLSEVVDELKQMMLSVETDTDARALLYDEIEGALSEAEKRAKEGEEEKIYREKKAKEKEGRVEIDEEFTEAELKEMATEQAELDRVKALENELEERKKKIKELWEKGKSALEKGGITGNSWKELGEANADLLKEVSAYVYAYAKLTGAKLKEAIKNVNDELFGGAFDIDEMAASPELIKAHEKGLADKGKTDVEEILEEETTTGEKRKKSTEQRVLEGGKAEPEVILGLIEQGVDYSVQSQDKSRKVAEKVVAAYRRKFGDNWKVELEFDLDRGAFSRKNLGAIPAYLYDALINASDGLVKARLINKLSDELIDISRFVAAMNDIHLKNPDALYQVKLAAIGKYIKQSLGFKDDGKAVDPRSKIGKIQDAQERLRRAKKESISEAAEKVTSKGQAKKGALSPEKRKERGKKKVDEALEGLKQWLTNPKMSAKMDLNDLYENQKEFNGLIFKLADGFFDQGVANAAQLITKMKEALANLGIDEDSFDSIKDRFLSDFDLENKLMDQRREEGAEKLAKKIVNLVKQPKKKEFDPVKQMVETLFGKVKETVTVPAKPKAKAEEKIQEALANFYEYESVFYKSRLEVIDMIDALDISDAEKRAMKDKLEKYMTEELNVPFGEKLSSEYVKQKMKEKAVDIKKVLLTANEIQAATREQFVSELVDKLRLDANLTASEAKKIADEFYKEYDKLIEAKKGQILKQTIGADVKAKFARKPEHQRIMEAIKHGALDGKMIKVKNEKGETGEYDSTYLFAEKYGIPDIYNPEIQETLKAFTESIAKLPPNSVQRKIVEREFNTYLDYLKGESKNRWQTILGMQYANILFDYGTHATIIASNIPMTMFNAALKIGRKLVFEQSRIKELGTLGHMMLKGFAKSSLSAKGILLYDTMREGSQVGRKDILRIKSKYANNKFLRGYFKFLSFSGRVLDALDAFVTVSMTDVEYTDFILDRLNAENNKLPKSERLTNKEIREYAYEIMGQTAPIIEQAENLATEEFKEQYGDDFEMTGKTAVLWKQRVAEIQRELGETRISRAGIPDWVSFTSQDMQRLFEQGTERAGKIGLVGKPAGSIGIVSALLEKMFQNILGGELLVKFLNAGMNSAAFVLKATPVSIVPVVKYYWTGKRGAGTSSSSDKIYEDLGVRREMYGYGGRIEKREELLTWLGFQAMTAIFMGSMFGEQAMTIFKSMFGGDDDDPEKTKNLGVEGRELYFGKKMDGKSGKWKEGLFVTGRMFGDSGNNWRKTQAFTQATGIEPMTVYYKGKKMFTYRNNPVYTAMFGTTGVASDLLLFNDKMDEITQGFIFKVAVSQSLMTLESSPMKGVSEIFALSAMRGDMVNMSDETFQRTLDGAIKTIALQTRNAFIPRFLMTMEQDIEGAMSQEDRIDLSWYELATRDWPIVNNLFDREIKYDHFGRPLLRKTKAKSFLLGVPAVDVADGTVYSPVLFDVSNEGEVSSPFANSVRGGESAREYALFASKGSRAYLLPDGKVVKITGNKGEVKTVKMDKRQYNEFANKVSLRFGDYVRENFEELSKYPSQREYDKLVEEGKETPYPPFDEVVKDEKNIIIESVLQDMFLGAKEKSYPIRLVTKEE